jgi:cytochrome c oxidase subunit 2
VPALLAGLLAALLVAPAASATFLLPESGGSSNADDISSLYQLVLYVAVVVFLVVEGALIYSLVRYRRSRNPVAAQIRGNTRIELAWTVGATLILVVLAIVTFTKLPDIQHPPNSSANGFNASNGVMIADSKRRLPPDGKSLNICVNGQQYIWRYTYASDCHKATENVGDSVFSYQQMVVPVGTTVTLDISAQDVAHSWWIPKLGGKFDAIPGVTNHTWINIPENKAGTIFTGQCAELCGRNHANMTAQVLALSVPDFEKWFARQKADIKAANIAAIAQRRHFEGATP